MSGFSAAVSVRVCERMRVCGRMCIVYPCVDVSYVATTNVCTYVHILPTHLGISLMC